MTGMMEPGSEGSAIISPGRNDDQARISCVRRGHPPEHTAQRTDQSPHLAPAHLVGVVELDGHLKELLDDKGELDDLLLEPVGPRLVQAVGVKLLERREQPVVILLDEERMGGDDRQALLECLTVPGLAAVVGKDAGEERLFGRERRPVLGRKVDRLEDLGPRDKNGAEGLLALLGLDDIELAEELAAEELSVW